METKKIYSITQIEGACIIGSPIVAGILIAHNYKVFGERQKGTAWIFIGFLWTFTLIGLAMLIPEGVVDSIQMFIPITNGLILYPIINKTQGDRIKEHFDNDGLKGSNWIVVGLTALVVAIILTPIIILDRISPINDYTRHAFNSNGIYYNSSMPLEEVNKLGGILQRIEYFNTENTAEVVFISTDTTFEFKLIMEKSLFHDTILLNETKLIFNHVGSYDFEKPLIFKITDQYLNNDKVITIDNYDSIPILFEVEFFSRNPNFRLIYNKSIDEWERKKFQGLIMNMEEIFSAQNSFDFLIDLENESYHLKLFIPKQSWYNPQLLSEVKYIKQKLNNAGFNYPFKVMLVDNSTIELEEKEVE